MARSENLLVMAKPCHHAVLVIRLLCENGVHGVSLHDVHSWQFHMMVMEINISCGSILFSVIRSLVGRMTDHLNCSQVREGQKRYSSKTWFYKLVHAITLFGFLPKFFKLLTVGG